MFPVSQSVSQNINQSCQNQSGEQNFLGNLRGPKDNKGSGQCPGNEYIIIDSHIGAMFEVYKNVLPGSNRYDA
jgi:hypothetical protein